MLCAGAIAERASKAHAEAEADAHPNTIVHAAADSHVHSAEPAAPGHSEPSTGVAAGVSGAPPSQLPSEVQLADVESGERVRT